ncbi:DUF58 domain-containing protein [Bacillus sp. FJAT-49736]|uniref:DUF58 domain-containing protein n=1 Tax=Bacillus sp. FJAT-49736 TaxID=2833582 RepID=UPI001BC97E97|nr:DUF58 domain-containing protein [Bacillus sp. FJAT-49736]MBS4172335.1 DUF58 domain-containing protein [Bacillus sp. FJAT-49736]
MVRTRKRGMHKGVRKSPKFGSSLEFSDFRTYQPGDDLRQIDWNIYGRTKKHYIKRFLDEQEIKTAVYLDSTSSVTAIESKWERAKQLAAALSYITLTSEDKLSFVPIASNEDRILTRKGAVHAKSCLYEIIQWRGDSKAESFTECIQGQLLRDRQLNIIITDGLEPIEKYEMVFNKLGSVRGDVWFIQILSQLEEQPPYVGDLKLIDSETAKEVNISITPKLVEEYKKKQNEHNAKLQGLCKRLGFQYFYLNDAKSIDEILMKDWLSRGWIK